MCGGVDFLKRINKYFESDQDTVHGGGWQDPAVSRETRSARARRAVAASPRKLSSSQAYACETRPEHSGSGSTPFSPAETVTPVLPAEMVRKDASTDEFAMERVGERRAGWRERRHRAALEARKRRVPSHTCGCGLASGFI